MDKKKYTPVEIKFIAFDAEDIITESNEGNPDEWETPGQG